MARILFFAFLAICVVQLASPAPRTGYGLTRTFFEDAAEAPTVSAVQATEVGILDGLGLIQVDLADAVSANQISVEDPALSVSDLTLEVQLNKEKTRVEADATMRSRDAALDGLWTVLEASANGDLDAAKEASKFALRASLDASQDAEEVVSAAVAASAEIAKTAEQRVQATMVDAVERAQMALEIASEIDITYGTQGESTETSEAAIEVTKIANEVFDEIMEKAVADAQRIQQEAAAEMKALKAVGKQAKEAADEALDAAKKAAEAVEKTVEEEVKLAVQLGTDEDFLTAVLAANDADKEINFELVATSAVRDEVDTAIQDGLDAIDGLETLSDIIIDDYIFKAEIAKETTDDQIEVALAIAANEEADDNDAETNGDRNVGIVLDESDNVFTILPYNLDHETNVEDPGLAEFALDYEDEGTMNILPFNYYMEDEQFEVRDPILPVDLSIDGNVEKDQEHTMTILPVDLNLDANVEKGQEHTMTILPVDLNLDANAQKDQEHTMTILPVDLNLDANVEKDQEHTMTILPVDLNLGANVVAQETEVTPNLLSDILAVADGNGQQPAVDTDLVNIDLGVSNNIPATEEIPAEHTDAEITIDVYYDDIPDSQADTEQEEGSVQVPVVDVHEIAQENPSNDITSVTVDSSDNADTPVAAQDAVNEITPEVTVAEADHEEPSVDTASVAVELSVNADTSANADESDAEIKASVENVEQTQESVNIPVVAVHEVSQEKPSTDTASVTVDSSVNADIPVAAQDAVNEITPEVAVSEADHEEPSVDTASVAVKLSLDTDTSAGESDAEIKTAVENAEQTQESVNIPVVAVHEVSQENPSTGTASVTVNLGVDTVGDALTNSGTEITTGVTPDVAVDAEPKQASGSVDDATSELVADVSDTTGSDAAPIVVSISGGNQSTDQDSAMSADDATAVLADTLGAAIKHLVRDDSTLVL